MPHPIFAFQSRKPAAAPSITTPAFDAVGAREQSSTGWAGGQALTLPAGYANKFGLVTVTVQTNTASVTTNDLGQGWTYLGKTTTTSGSNNRACHMWWKRLGPTETNPIVTVSSSVVAGLISTWTNVRATGDPVVILNSGDFTAGAPASVPGATTTVDKSLALQVLGFGESSAGGKISAWTNGDLVTCTEFVDDGTGLGADAHFAVGGGEKATAGTYGASSVTGVVSLSPSYANLELYGAT